MYTSFIISLSSIVRPVSKANSYTSKTSSTRSTKGALTSHTSLGCVLFLDIMKGLIGHYAIACTKRSHAQVFWKLWWRSCILEMSPGGKASCICFLTACYMLSHSFLYQRASLCAWTKFSDRTAINPIAITGGGPGLGGTTYGMLVVMRAYWAFERISPCYHIACRFTAWIGSRVFPWFISVPRRTNCSFPMTSSVVGVGKQDDGLIGGGHLKK